MGSVVASTYFLVDANLLRNGKIYICQCSRDNMSRTYISVTYNKFHVEHVEAFSRVKCRLNPTVLKLIVLKIYNCILWL